MVVAIIAITAALAAPALSRSMADRRASEATHALVRIGAQARSEAMLHGRAVVLRYYESSGGPSGSDGSVEMWRGRVDRCRANVWADLITADCSADARCVASLDMGNYEYPTHRVRMRIALDGVAQADICFEPNGDMYFSTGGAFLTNLPDAGANPDGVRFTFDRLEGGSAAGVQRAVVFPFGGTPRIVR